MGRSMRFSKKNEIRILRTLYALTQVFFLSLNWYKASYETVDNVLNNGTMGPMINVTYWKQAPQPCRTFMELIRRGYYNNTKFHKVLSKFMIQCGDPTDRGEGGQSTFGPQFDSEIQNDLKHTGAGILFMVNATNNTNGSQFFIILDPTLKLDGKLP